MIYIGIMLIILSCFCFILCGVLVGVTILAGKLPPIATEHVQLVEYSERNIVWALLAGLCSVVAGVMLCVH